MQASQRNQSHGIQLHIAAFDGEMELEEFLDWVHNVDNYFNWKELIEERKVKVVASKMRGTALDWWKNYQMDRERKGKKKINSWRKMKEKLKSQFLPSN